MKTSHIRFAQLQRFLEHIGFSKGRDERGWRSVHLSCDTVFLFRPYRPTDRVYEHDLFPDVPSASQRAWLGGAW